MSARESGAEAWVVDASVALKWFLPAAREPDGALARMAVGALPMRTTTLATYEVGNILIRQGGWSFERVARALDLLLEICRDPLGLVPADHAIVAQLAHKHDLTFYDASYAAIAQRVGRSVLSADKQLLDAGLAVGLREAFG